MTTRKADWSRRTPREPAGTTVKLDDTLTLPITPDEAWARLEDVPLVASCLPGLDPSSIVAVEPDSFRATMAQTVMGVTAQWDLRATLHPDPGRRRLKVELVGEDARLKLRLDGVADVAVESGGAGSARLDYTADVRVIGSLAAMGGPVIRSIVTDAIAQFVAVVGGAAPTKRRSLAGRLRERTRDWCLAMTGRRGRRGRGRSRRRAAKVRVDDRHDRSRT